MLLTQYIVKLMLKYKKGSIINVSSITGIDGNAGQLSYASSKAALIAATKTLSKELAPKGIRINAVAPGVIDTDMIKTMTNEQLNKFINKTSLQYIGIPSSVAKPILFLASDLSSYITGQVIRIDGGI
jgi:3-oxoacyl-[acyl-carrier protein] reductase